MFHGILCDLDDTLYPYEQFVLGGFQNAARCAEHHLGIDQKNFFQLCCQKWLTEGAAGNIFNQALDTLGLPHTFLEELVNAFRNHHPGLSLYPDAAQFLEALCGDLPLGIITDGIQEVQQRKVKALKLEEYFPVIIYSDAYGRENWKPSTKPYWEALKALGLPPSEKVVYVGDNPYKDFVGAKKLGLFTIRLLRGPFRHVQVSSEQDAHCILPSFKDVLEVTG